MKKKCQDSDKIKRDIIVNAKTIRQKFKKLMMAKMQEEDELNRKYQPIVQPLNKLIAMNENLRIENREDVPINEEVPADPTVTRYLYLFNSKPNKKSLDNVYGIRSAHSQWYLGNSNVSFINDHIQCNDEKVKATEGLLELLFMKKPNAALYDENDLKNYKKLILMTSAHKQGYDPNNQRLSSRALKYKHIIKPLFENGERTGSGMLVNVPRYEYWDDPNELVERLRLLLGSQASGNNSHRNEILSIVEELREANIIE
jgi:hypothetical protein